MNKWQLPFFFIAVAPATTLGLVAGGAHLAERAVAPIPAAAEPLGFPPLRLDRERIAVPPTLLDPTSGARLPMVVVTAASPAAPVAPDVLPPALRAAPVAPDALPPALRAAPVAPEALPPAPRAVAGAPLPGPTLARKVPERSLKPTGRAQPALTPRATPVARALQPDERPPSHAEAEGSNFAAVADGDPPPAATRGDRH